MSGYSDNLNVVLRDYERNAPTKSVYRGEVQNTQFYSVWLHEHEGYSVFNNPILLALLRKHLERELKPDRPFDTSVEMGAKAAMKEYVELIQSRTARMRPPIKAGGPSRPAHPAPFNWADRTTDLASSFRSIWDGGAVVLYPYDGTRYA